MRAVPDSFPLTARVGDILAGFWQVSFAERIPSYVSNRRTSLERHRRWFTDGCVRGYLVLRLRQTGVVIPESDFLSCAAYHSSTRLHTRRARQPLLHILSTHKRANKSLHIFLPNVFVAPFNNYRSYLHAFH